VRVGRKRPMEEGRISGTGQPVACGVQPCTEPTGGNAVAADGYESYRDALGLQTGKLSSMLV
jgi:hypothetical protein